MTPITVRSTVNVQDDAGDVKVEMLVGWAGLSDGAISVKPVGGTMTTPYPDVHSKIQYSLGPAANLITQHVRMILSGRVGDQNGAVQGNYFVICAFFQNGHHVGSSDPLSGKYAAGDALQDFNIICSFT